MQQQESTRQTGKTPQFDSIAISVASPEQILSWSYGEVKKPETINYRTQKPERDGLFCERIFGPTKNWECYCGKYKRIRYRGVICEKCGVEVTRSIVRRYRMGHIKLAVPIAHIWFLRSTPSRLGLLLDLPIKSLEQIVYFAAYLVINVDENAKKEAFVQLEQEHKNYKKKVQEEYQTQVREMKDKQEKNFQKKISGVEKDQARRIEELEMQHAQAHEDLANINVGTVLSEVTYRDLSMKFGHVFKAGTGAEAIRELVSQIDFVKMVEELKIDLKRATGQRQKKTIKRLKLIGSLQQAGVKPEWMVLTVLPVIPPDLRPMVQLDGGRYAASDLNDLYRRVINRNNRLKRLIAIGAPDVICRNEKRMLQEAVDTLLNNSARSGRTVFNTGDKRKLRSLSDMLKGKQGRFRQNLLGKRVDYSGRSVIVVGPKLKLSQCGLPKTMALELFKPFVIGRLIRDGYAHNIKNAERLIQGSRKEVWDILEEVTKNYLVLLNRAPTLHRLGIQAFQPVLVEGKAIQVHPLVCAAFNADFDGDQMAVHVPLSKLAQEEAHELMLSTQNLLKPSAGEPITTATQDMVLGCYYLTHTFSGKKGEGMVFSGINEAITAYDSGVIALQAQIKTRISKERLQKEKEEIVETTVGRLIFNSFIPEELGFRNYSMVKDKLIEIVGECFEKLGRERTVKLCDEIKRVGFQFATKSGLSISHTDMVVPKEKDEYVQKTQEKVKKINAQYLRGLMTDDERYRHTINAWAETKNEITNIMRDGIIGENDIAYMVKSGARGNWGQITQLCGMKGLVANPAGKTIELPIVSNLKEGFTILEYFIATHGGRKGKSDTALKTAEAGYLTRRLVDAVQDIVIRQKDCGSLHKHEITAEESQRIGEAFEHRIFGRTLMDDMKVGKEVIAEAGAEIDKKIIAKMKEHNIRSVYVRSVMNCQTRNGVCQKCYGSDLGTNETVELGTAVGIIAAQSIGEPGTQLTMRTFHMGGVAESGDITQGLTRVEELFEARPPKYSAILSEISGKVKIVHKVDHAEVTISSDEPHRHTYNIDENLKPTVKKGQKVKERQELAKHDEFAELSVRADFDGIIEDVDKEKIILRGEEKKFERTYPIPRGRSLRVSTGDLIAVGDALTIGHMNLRDFWDLTSIYTCQRYIMTEVQSIYASQGQTINDKHIEIIVRQMFSKARIVDPGDSDYLPGETKDFMELRDLAEELKKAKKRPVKFERLLLGLTRVALCTSSWLSASSFQETIRVLVEASTTRRVDALLDLKANVIIGKPIPAGSVYRKKHPDLVQK